jgi:spermidine synthase
VVAAAVARVVAAVAATSGDPSGGDASRSVLHGIAAVTETPREIRIRPVHGPGHLLLRETGELVEIMAGDVVLLSSAALGTEFAFGRLAGSLGRGAPSRVIIGGLGFGATLRGVLEVAAPEASVVVVEKVDAIVRLVRGPLSRLAGKPLEDPRVQVVRGDVGDVVAEAAGDVDAILLDVDNGPHWASFRTNSRLYTLEGLAGFKRALVPGGALAVWSGYKADSFLGHLRGAGFASSVLELEENGKIRARAYIGHA